MFSRVFKEWKFSSFEVDKLCMNSWFDCPSCHDQQHSCHVDGNNKLYRYKTSGRYPSFWYNALQPSMSLSIQINLFRRSGPSYYGDLFIINNKDVDNHLELLGYSNKSANVWHFTNVYYYIIQILDSFIFNFSFKKEIIYCGSNILKAAQDKSKTKVSLDETGFEYCVCRHGVAQKGLTCFAEKCLATHISSRRNSWWSKRLLTYGMTSYVSIGLGWE